MEKKILVAMDDSENAMRAAAFVAQSFSHENSVTLFSVVLDTPAICDLTSPGLTPYFMSQKASFCSLEDKKKDLVTEAQQKAKELLLESGFKEDHIVLKMEDKKKGVARGIVEEAGDGYDVVVLGRRGLSGIKDFFMGSVSQKVLQSAKNVSVLMVD